MSTTRLALGDEVAEALRLGNPVVALETTIVSHGMPWPDNLDTALAVEAIVRDAGAVPATIAVVDGALRIGLDNATLRRLARAHDVLKLSTADLAYAIVSGGLGATTVAATILAARIAGIDVFATGGIGGVHRGAERSFDISADLSELARSAVIVVASGAKALLDLPRTLEVLETLAVPVICYRSDEFPAFWSRRSGLSAPIRLDAAADIAAVFTARAVLRQSGGVLVANPVRSDCEIPLDEIRPHIEAALAEAGAAGIAGKAVTPFLLDAVHRRTGGRSLAANIALIKDNARLAAAIAVAVADIRRRS